MMQNKRVLIFLMSMLSLHARFPVDSIKSIVYGEQETIIITDSELKRPGLDGQVKSLDDLITEALIYLDAKRMGAVPDPEAMQRNWDGLKKQNNLSEDDMRKIVEQAGYTLPEAKMQLGKMSAINQMIELKVKSGLFVTKQEVERYYNAHPEIEQAEYEIMRAVVPFSAMSTREDLRNHLLSVATSGCDDPLLRWSSPLVLVHDAIAADKRFIYAMKPGEISRPLEISNGFELFKLVSKMPERIVPLAERYDEIEQALKMPKYKELMDAYKKELYERATVVIY
jgi:parvulin-like peptidyl-prolyl isomerase